MLIPVGMAIRYDGTGYRPAREEIRFARDHGFAVLQFRGSVDGLDARRLGSSPQEVAAALKEAGIGAVMEIMLGITGQGRSPKGRTLLEVLQANLPAITTLGCAHVHLHLMLSSLLEEDAVARLEHDLVPQFAAGVNLAHGHGFRFGCEHNTPDVVLLATPRSCAMLLQAVPDLGFVWDINHTLPEHLAGYLALLPRMTLLHVSDTPAPVLNHHLPLGEGSLDIAGYCGALRAGGFAGPAILEIGGTAASGGFGRDTDVALLASRVLLAQALTDQKAVT